MALSTACSQKKNRIVIHESFVGDSIKPKDSVDLVPAEEGIKNGDIVVVTGTYEMLTNTRINAAYRVVAGPVDSIKFDDNAAYVNGKVVLQPYLEKRNIYILDSSISKAIKARENITFRIPLKGEHLDASYPMPLLFSDASKNRIVSTKYYFILNDDYSAPNDSRDMGLIPVDSILGIVKVIHHKTTH